MTEANMKSKKTYIGLWVKNDKNGNPFLSGSTDTTVYFIFGDSKNPGKKTLHTIDKQVEGSKMLKVGTFDTGEGVNGEYQYLNNMYIYKNTRREKENHPDFNMVVYEDEKVEA